jgi:hypothetical protein
MRFQQGFYALSLFGLVDLRFTLERLLARWSFSLIAQAYGLVGAFQFLGALPLNVVFGKLIRINFEGL